MSTGLFVVPNREELNRRVRSVLHGLPNVDALIERLEVTAGMQTTGRLFAGVLEDLFRSWAPGAPRDLVGPFLRRIIDQMIDAENNEARQSAYERINSGTRAVANAG